MNQVKYLLSALLWICLVQSASSHSGIAGWMNDKLPTHHPDLMNDIIVSRLQALECLVTPRIEEDVIDQVKRFIGRDRMRAMDILHRTEIYFPLIERIFGEYGLPKELKYLTIVESSLVINAKSRVGAAGLWQLMPATAKILQLRVDEKMDQRLDPVLSTHAAARYFKTLYGLFGDWSLVLAAYNSGEYRIKRILQNSNKKDFWSIRGSLPRQTQLFVPAFIGASYFVEYSEIHEMVPSSEIVESQRLSFAKIFKEVNLKDLYRKTAIKPEIFKLFNPGYKKPLIPASTKGYSISLPDSLMVEFIDYYTYQNRKNQTMAEPQWVLNAEGLSDAEIISFTRPAISYPDNIQVVQAQTVQLDFEFTPSPSSELEIPKSKPKPVYTYHIVGHRESLFDIAEDYRISLEDLLSWNDSISIDHINTGAVIRILQQPPVDNHESPRIISLSDWR